MTTERTPSSQDGNPASCGHARFQRIGIQKAPVPPYRLYLMTCRACGTTLATMTLRRVRESVPAAVREDGSSDDRDDDGRAPVRRKAG
jgi:hypothetical protein